MFSERVGRWFSNVVAEHDALAQEGVLQSKPPHGGTAGHQAAVNLPVGRTRRRITAAPQSSAA